MKLALVLPVLLLCLSASAGEKPLRLGVDDGGSYHYFTLGRRPWEVPAYYRALEELGARFLSIHFWPVTDQGEKNADLTRERFDALDRSMREHGLTYTVNVELSNWVPGLEVTPDVDEFAHPGGVHRWDVRMDWLSPLLPPARPGPPALLAITYDECEHMLLSNNKFANAPESTFDKPFLVSTHGLDLQTAYDALVQEATRIREQHYQGRIRPQTEQVWPDLFHLFARSGWIITPKLLKENIGSVVMSIALGAAIQYADAGTTLWASPDLWNQGRYPGHSPQALRSALLMAYWLGAETIYVENLDFHTWDKRHPDSDPQGSLIRWSDAEHFELTRHGRIVREFYRQYVPANPRMIDWRDYDPRVAIIRLPDGGWGQHGPEQSKHEPDSRNRLLGNRDMPADEPAREWLDVWPILTHGAARDGSISSGNGFIYPKGVEEFFAPIDSVAVFDHRVTAAALRNVECLIVCGHALSRPTFEAVQDRVAAGATCVIARRLFEAHISKPLEGRWLVVDDFKDRHVAEAIEPFLGPPDVARFRFKRNIVEFRRGNAPDAIDVRVIDRQPESQPASH